MFAIKIPLGSSLAWPSTSPAAIFYPHSFDRDYPDLVGTPVTKTTRNAAPNQSLPDWEEKSGTEDANTARKSSEDGPMETSLLVASPPCVDSSASEVTVPLPKLVINKPQFIRLAWFSTSTHLCT